MLKGKGYGCVNLAEIGLSLGCISGEEADIDCLRDRMAPSQYRIIEGHYAHLMNCSHVIILERSTEDLRKVYESRGYNLEKAEDNIEAQDSGTIYSEALDILPSTRIFTIRNSDGMDQLLREVTKIIDNLNPSQFKS